MIIIIIKIGGNFFLIRIIHYQITRLLKAYERNYNTNQNERKWFSVMKTEKQIGDGETGNILHYVVDNNKPLMLQVLLGYQ